MSCLNFRGYKRTATGLPLNLIASMFLSKLTISGNTEQRNLPEGYTQVEYLESTGTQYIDTGIYPSNNTKVEVVFSTSSKPDQFLYGARTAITNPEEGHYTNVCLLENIIYCGFDTNNQSYDCTYNSDKNTVVNSQDGLYLNGTLITTYAEATFTSQRSMYLFGLHESSGVELHKFNGKIYSFKTYESGTLTHNLIPCTRDTDSKPGMYDTMTDTFMTNAGTGEFMAGAEVAEPTPDNPIDVQLCGDRTANLFDVNDPMDIVFENDNGWITVTYNNSEGTTIEYVGVLVKPSEEIEPNTDYIIVTEVESLASGVTIITNSVTEDMYKSQFATQVSVTQTGTNIVQATSRNSFANCTTMLRTFVAYHAGESGTCKFRISVLPVGTDTSNFVYEPYGYKINGEVIGENLFDGVWRQGLSWSTSNASTRLCNTQEIAVKKGETYTIISYANNFRIGIGVSTVFPCTNASTIVDETEWQSDVLTITASVDGYLLTTMRYADNSNISPDNATDTMLLKGSYTADTIPPYEPYQPPQDFAVYLPQQIGKVDSAVDKIVLDMENKTAELTRQYRRYDFTGTENWTIEYATGYGDDGKRFAMVADVPYSGRKKTPNNRFSTTTDNVHINNIMFSSVYNIYLYMSACSTVDELKTYLQNNPTYAYIPYSTPQTTDITALQDWDAMPDVKGTVTLTLSAEVEPSGAEAVYYSKERNTE